MALSFRAKIYKVGINPLVDVPREVSLALGKRGFVSVKGALNGYPYRATLVPKGKGAHVLHINGAIREVAGVDVGAEINLILEMDAAPRVPPMPKEFAWALKQNPRAQAVFDKFPPSHKKEYLVYLNNLKRPETLQRNVDKVIVQLLEKCAGKKSNAKKIAKNTPSS
jgi:hypothetical protein